MGGREHRMLLGPFSTTWCLRYVFDVGKSRPGAVTDDESDVGQKRQKA